MTRLLLTSLSLAALAGCAAPSRVLDVSPSPTSMSGIAESYVKLALTLGTRDPDYVDAYYGPPDWKATADTSHLTPDQIRTHATALRAALANIDQTTLDPMSRLRREYLDKQLRAMVGRVDFLDGKRLPFDEESRLMYDAVAPTNSEAHYEEVLARLDAALPGAGPLAQRYQAFRGRFVIPRDKLDTVFRTAIDACRSRTAAHVALPPGESFTVEYVTNKPWSAYNWYKGDYHSVIQVNTDLPIFIDRAVDLACHEGYPGHHVYNALLEQKLVRGRGWKEFSVYPLFSPQSLIAEGSANHGISVAFPGGERVTVEREKLFPLAGLDPAGADEYYRIFDLAKDLSYASNEVARRYLDGEIDAVAAANWLTKYALYEPARAEQRVRFMDKYRSYVINYNLGQDLVRRYVGTRAGGDAQRTWDVFAELLSSPRLPSGLR
jgi:hypothetical protein